MSKSKKPSYDDEPDAPPPPDNPPPPPPAAEGPGPAPQPAEADGRSVDGLTAPEEQRARSAEYERGHYPDEAKPQAVAGVRQPTKEELEQR